MMSSSSSSVSSKDEATSQSNESLSASTTSIGITSSSSSSSFSSSSDDDDETTVANNGRTSFRENLRSIAQSLASFTLFLGFNALCIPSVVSELKIRGLQTDGLDFTTVNNNNNNNKFASLLEKSYKKLNNKSNNNKGQQSPKIRESGQLTANLAALLRDKKYGFIVESEAEAEAPRFGDHQQTSQGKSDILISKKRAASSNGQTAVPLGLVEVGLLLISENHDEGKAAIENDVVVNDDKLEKLFWKKLGQASAYLKNLLIEESNNNQWREKQCLLLCVLVVVVVATARNNNCSQKEQGGRLAVFSCELKNNKKKESWRMALLWRTHQNSIDELSKAFGCFLNGVEYLKMKGEEWEKTGHDVWKYLGPNCTRVVLENGERYVIRVYDNRGLQTSRSPQVYKIEKTLKVVTKTVLVQLDNNVSSVGGTIEFGAPLVEEDEPAENEKSLLFYMWNKRGRKGGKIEVIAVPYVEGGHVCKNAYQAYAAVIALARLQHQNLIHADIRARNIVFSENGKTVHFIDWDYGGHVDQKRRYPPGYVQRLPDAHRCGEPEELTTFNNDVRDLANILGTLHMLPKKASLELVGLLANLGRAGTLRELFWFSSRLAKKGKLPFLPEDKFGKYLNGLDNNNDITQTIKDGEKISPARAQNKKK